MVETASTPAGCAIVLCHPRQDSFCAALANEARAGAISAGYDPTMRNLYAMGFDPVLHARDIATSTGGSPAPDVDLELALLDQPVAVVLIYPIWFGGPPALLKGYVERVLGKGHAGPGTTPVNSPKPPQLLVTLATSAASLAWLGEHNVAESAGAAFGDYLAAVLGIGRHEHIGLHEVTPQLPQSRAKQYLSDVETKLCGWLGAIREGPGMGIWR